MKKQVFRWRWMHTVIMMMMPFVVAWAAVEAIDENGNYFVNSFESDVPPSSPDTETAIYVEGQGEWLFFKAFVSTNSKYVNTGNQNLRLYKNGSYVVTPVLDKGVKEINFFVDRDDQHHRGGHRHCEQQ